MNEYKSTAENKEQAVEELRKASIRELLVIANSALYHGWYRRAAKAVLKEKTKK